MAPPPRADDDRGCVFLSQPAYTAHESQGELQITIERTNPANQEQIRYGVRHLDSQPGLDLDTAPNTYVVMAPGQTSYTFDVRIIDRGMNATPVYAMAYIYGSYPDRLCDATGRRYRHGPVNSRITILRDDPLDAKNPADLVRHADFHITGPRERLLHDGPYVPYDGAVAPNRSHSRLTHFNRQR